MFLSDLLSVKMKEMTRQPHIFARLWPSCFNSKVVSFVRQCVEHRSAIFSLRLIRFFSLLYGVGKGCGGL